MVPGKARDDQPYGRQITRLRPGPVNELNRAAQHDRAFAPVAADEPGTIADPHPHRHGRLEKTFAPCAKTGTLATGELAGHQPHAHGCPAQAQLRT
jgi:hypothetical protein